MHFPSVVEFDAKHGHKNYGYLLATTCITNSHYKQETRAARTLPTRLPLHRKTIVCKTVIIVLS